MFKDAHNTNHSIYTKQKNANKTVLKRLKIQDNIFYIYTDDFKKRIFLTN